MIYNFDDGRGIYWLACMIQATGIPQRNTCKACQTSESPFIGCVVAGGHLFPKCGNCEWNGVQCCGLGPLAAAVEEASAKAYDADSYSPPHTSVSRCKAVNKTPRLEPASPDTAITVTSPVPPSAHSYGRGSRASSCPTSRQLIPMAMRPTNFGLSSSHEIVKETLVLRDNGMFYTHPKCIEGVPVEKVSRDHPYWEPGWPDPRVAVEYTLRSWKKKHQEAKKKKGRGKFACAREVNRGNLILKFLEQGPISPHQLLSKHFMSASKGRITSYASLFRLAETLEALPRYKTDVEPVDWLRQRLHELIQEQGNSFDLPKTIEHFYNDPKLVALRQKSGFPSIGKPPGTKTSRGGSVDGPPPGLRKRRRKNPPAEPVSELSTADVEGHDGKRQRVVATVLDSLGTGEISDADSWSGAPITEYDFRVYQIKTRRFTSSERVTQYLGWVAEDGMFEHQVLKNTNPVDWGVYREQVDFWKMWSRFRGTLRRYGSI